MIDDFDRSNQTVTLRDGRKLGFADYGTQSGTLTVSFYTHFEQILQQIVDHAKRL